MSGIGRGNEGEGELESRSKVKDMLVLELVGLKKRMIDVASGGCVDI